MKSKYYIAPLLFIVIGLAGCVTVPMASASRDATAKQFMPDPENSIIYVYRNAFLGGGVKMSVVIDGELEGVTIGQTYVRAVVAAGTHKLVSIARNNSTLVLTTEPGKIYFVHQKVKFGVPYAGASLISVDVKTGEAGVRECHLVSS